MDKFWLQQQVLERLAQNLLQAEQAARTAHETATHGENIAESKYVTIVTGKHSDWETFVTGKHS